MGEVKFYGIPKHSKIDTVISVNQTIPHSDYFTPWYLGIVDLARFTDPASSFTKNFHKPDQCEEPIRTGKGFESRLLDRIRPTFSQV